MDHFTYKNGELHAEGIAISEIAASVGTPFYCYSSATFIRHFNVFNDVLADINHKVFFAVKANSNLAVLKTLAQQGCGADTVSAGEIFKSLKAGIPASNIVFSGVGKTREEMVYALEQGIFQFNAESKSELTLLNEVAGSMGKQAPVALRVNPAVDPQTHEKISTGQKESKFGIAFAEVREAYDYAASLPHLKVQGVSMHIGSQLTSLTPFRQAFRAILKMTNELRAAGHDIQTLDLGGGLGVPYGDEEQTPPLPTDYAKAVAEEIGEFKGTLLFEPGRMIAANAGIMISKIIHLKDNYVICDAGMNDLMRPSLYEAYHEIIPVMQNDNAITHHHIVGPVCESSDIFGKDRPLPTPKVDDLIALRSAGAYGASMSNDYNARPLIAEVMVSGDKWAVVRERPSYDEMIQNQKMPDWL